MHSVLLLLALLTQQPQLPISPPIRQLKEPAQPSWMSTDACLMTTVSLAAHGRPLREVLVSLSQRAGVTIRAARDIEEFRVSIDCHIMPIGQIMARILDINGHGKLPAIGYDWYRDIEKGQPTRYLLKRSLKALQEEEALLDQPARTAMKWLREMRDYSHLPPEKRKGMVSDSKAIQHVAQNGGALEYDGVRPVGEAVAALTDGQIEALINDGHVGLPDFSLSPAALASIKSGEPKGIGDAPQSSNFSLRAGMSGGEGEFEIMLRYGANSQKEYSTGFNLDTLDIQPSEWDEEAIRDAERREAGPVVDLTGDEKGPPVPLVKISLTEALSLLAKEAKIPLFSEIYIKDPGELRFTRGKPEYLLTRICKAFGCDWRKVDGDYLVYSKTWAQDRAGDVSEPVLKRWADVKERQGRFEFDDYLEMSLLGDRQVVTLQKVLGAMGPLSPRNRDALRAMAPLSKQQRQAAYGPDGVEIVQPNEQQLQTLRKQLDRDEIIPPFFVRLTLRDGSGKRTEGIAIDFADRKGKSRAGAWVFLGQKWALDEP